GIALLNFTQTFFIDAGAQRLEWKPENGALCPPPGASIGQRLREFADFMAKFHFARRRRACPKADKRIGERLLTLQKSLGEFQFPCERAFQPQSTSVRRTKSEICLQFCPQPIDEPISLDRSGVVGGQRFRFADIAVQAVEIREQQYIIDACRSSMSPNFQ